MIPDDDLSHIGISLPKKLLDDFDEILSFRKYTSRSEGIRDAIRIYNINNQWLSDSDSERKGVITMVYDCRDNALMAAIFDIRYEFNEIIRASLQTYVNRNKRLEIFLVQGTGVQLKAFADLLAEKRGIDTVKITTIPMNANPGIRQGIMDRSS